MYLKQIELHGFKSFANDTILNFEKGINGIVGPNGSGKSNISDAVRWVLGERSMKQLRSAESTDVIFSGTEFRKAQAFAYVCLTIDNSDRKLNIDYDEVAVSRRLYRDGESEYKLNGTMCRLKDIVEIFYDTGIGKEGYSIIGQGQIDKIISEKPEDRRELFDEAVGIVKYKKRKASFEKKLEETRDNLSKVSIVLEELIKQIGPLQKKAETAEKYLKIKDELLLYESNYFIREIEKQSNIISDANNKLEINKENLKKNSDNRKAFSEKYDEIEKEMSNLEIEINDLRNAVTDKSILKENCKNNVNLLKEQINSENQNNKGRVERINQIKITIDDTVSKIKENIAILKELKKQISFISTNNTDLEDSNTFDGDLSLICDCLDNAKNTIFGFLGEDYDITKNIDASSIYSNETTFNAISVKRKEIEDIDKKISDANNRLNDFNNKLTENNEILDKTNEEFIDKQNLFHVEESRLENIKNLLERYEGYNDPVKLIFDKKTKFPGIRGVVADLIETEKDYENAIETALGGAIQNIVTDNVETSKSIIGYLKEIKGGRVTTLPLSSLIVGNNEQYLEAKKEKGVIDLAVNLTKYKDEYKTLSEFLLARCLIVDNFDNAKEIFKKYKSSIKIVTLAGDLFNPGGAVSGGAYKDSSNLIGRKREYEELKVSISNIKNDIDNLIQKKNRLIEDSDMFFNNIEHIKEDINKLNIDKNTITLNIISDMKLEYSNISNKAKYSTEDTKRLLNELTNLYTEKEKMEAYDISFIDTIKNKEQEINKYENDITKIDDELRELEDSINEKNKKRDADISNRREYIDNKDKLAEEEYNLRTETLNLNNDIDKANRKIEDVTNQMLDNYGLSYVDAKEKYDENLGTEEYIEDMAKQKRKIFKDLGSVDLNAIDEYKNIGNRHEVTTTQYQDIKESEEKLAIIVADLDKEMKQIFDSNFEKIKLEFDRVFKELFGGGHAELDLMETDLGGELEAGVKLTAQPPGLALSNMSQLSGGQKALTAIALLFAIQNLKPSPFCLLDEIEAALDEANVYRFADYLKKLTSDTQFIVITHRRGTMENSDRLYGITMQEKGITTIVSVDLVSDILT